MYRTKKQQKKPRPRLAIDFDGVLHRYSRGFQDGSIYDRPVPDAQKTLKSLIKKYWIYIYTTRADTKSGRIAVEKWLRKNKIPFNEVVSKKPVAFAYIDDRAIHFDNWKQAVKDLTEMWTKHTKKLNKK